MTESRLQFTVGLFVIGSAIVGAGLALRFGELKFLWEKSYNVTVHFPEAPNVQTGTPVRKNGVNIGRVSALAFDEQHGGVSVTLALNTKYTLRADSHPRLTQSLLGDSTVEFSPGSSAEILKPGAVIEGSPPVDPMKLVARLESKVFDTLTTLHETTDEWKRVGKNVNSLVETNRGNLDQVVERAAESLSEFTIAMKSANKYLSDPQNEENLKKTLAALPAMVKDTQLTITAVRSAVQKMDENMGNLNRVTAPLAKRSDAIVAKLDGSMGNLEILLAELNVFAQAVNAEDGSLKKFVSDPELYRNLNQTASTLNTLMRNLDPVIRDIRVFSDKISRHPELIGVGGALRPSSGVKAAEYQKPATTTRRE